MTSKTALQAQIRDLQRELSVILDAERDAENASFSGKHYRVRNNYSCPSKPSDYWWMYVGVIDTRDGIFAMTFQTDSRGEVRIEKRAFYMPVTLNSYQQITKREFESEFRKMLARVGKLSR